MSSAILSLNTYVVAQNLLDKLTQMYLQELFLILMGWKPMDIIKCCISTLEKFCLMFTATILSFCLFVGLFTSSFVYNNLKGDWFSHLIISNHFVM